MIDVFELQCIDQRLEAVCHLLRRVWVDDEDGPHLAISWIVTVTVFAHWVCELR